MNHLLKTIWNKWPLIAVLSFLTSCSLFLLMMRLKITASYLFLFLVWNLFLAGIPYAITEFLKINDRVSRFRLFIGFGIWLLFLPNAPYILTDFVHLRYLEGSLIWYDIVLIFSFAITGLLFYFASLSDMLKLIRLNLGKRVSNTIMLFVPWLCGFGIYLGRVLRWNSWDILQDPFALANDILDIVLQPETHPTAWWVIGCYGLFLSLGYPIWKLTTRHLHSPADRQIVE